MEDLSGLYLLADVCDQELRALSSARVPVKFPKKRRSGLVLIKNETETTEERGLKLKVSPTHIGKRCYFQLDNGHVGDKIADDGYGNRACGVDYKGNKKHRVTATLASFATSSSGGDVDGHGNGVCGVDYKGKKKQRVSFTLSGNSHVSGDHNMENKKQIVTKDSNFAPFASSSSGGVDSHDNGVCGVDYYNGKKKQRVTGTFSFFASTSSGDLDGYGNEVCWVDYTRKNKQIVTDSCDLASGSSGGDVDGHGNWVSGVDYSRKKKQMVTDSMDFASSSCSGDVDGHGKWVSGVDYKEKKTQRISFILSGRSKFDGEDNLGEKITNQNITATPSSSSLQAEAPSTPSSSSGLNLRLPPHFRFHLEYPNLPTPFLNRIQAMGGSKVKLVIEKNLFKSDLNKGLNRLSIPCSQIKNEFLRQEEKMALGQIQNDGKHLQGMDVSVIEPCLDLSTLCLKKWEFNSTSSYVLIKNWNNVAEKNKLKLNMTVQLWSFRLNTALCFALVNLSQSQQ